ncbi:glycosyltransferase family 39 protein [Sinomonas notoginsengisoli]|uniref:glycosyltransferase family 39 protein n=1 Tax=Sinomonas notoginsengisoli TaxID=1457311 RepID=UPI001F386E21|nr:glycosyltransferase family 39 protein [Sinomonas notoginsengisoli]
METAALLLATAALYLWNLSINGWSNPYYSAAAFAESDNFPALLFGALDPGNGISVDKPPLAVWVMSLSVKIFGLNSWSIQVPQALMGVATVWIVYRMAASILGHGWGLLAGVLMALMPVSTAVFRFNNPDALLTLLMTGAAALTLAALKQQRVGLLAVAGVLLGAGFLTKQLQVAVMIPAVVAAVALARDWSLRPKVLGALAAASAAIATAGSWLAVVALTPATNRPFIGGTQNNSFLELTLGYNGLDRLTGVDVQRAQVGYLLGSGDTMLQGPVRFLYPQMAAQIAWILPLACAGTIVTVMVWRRSHDHVFRAFLVLNTIWFVVSAGVVSMMSGIVHPYYVLAMVPPGVCVAVFGLKALIDGHAQRSVRLLLGATTATTLIATYVNALRGTDTFPWFPTVALVIGSVATAWAFLPPLPPLRRPGLACTLCLVLVGPFLWSGATAAVPHAGAGLAGGPAIAGYRSDDPNNRTMPGKTSAGFAAASFGNSPDPQILQMLRMTPTAARWQGAVIGSESAALYELESGTSVLAVGGFDGTDPFPTLDQFKAMVSRGEVGNFIAGPLPPAPSLGFGEAAKILEWVRTAFPCTRSGTECVYQLQP